MAAIGCPHCGKTIDSVDVACRWCGAAVTPQVVKKISAGRWILGSLGALGLIVLVGFLQAGGGTSISSNQRPSVSYRVSGTTSKASLTYTTASGGTAQEDVSVPWTFTFDAETRLLYLSAQNKEDSGAITATIIVDGRELQSTTSRGAYVIATASGSVR